MIAFVFPGQGSQYVGMGKELCDEFVIARNTFEEANDSLGFNLSGLCFEGEQSELSLTANAQPALLTTSIACLRVLQSETSLNPDYVAGHSLGEYTALVANGAFKLTDAVKVVRKRGEFMQEAVPVGVGAMAAVLGLEKEKVEEICNQVSQNGLIASPANLNAPGQTVISGNTEAIAEASTIAKEEGAKRVVPLDVSAPFHCALMKPAADRLSGVLNEVNIAQMSSPLVANCTASVTNDSSMVKELLVSQVTSPVRWYESVEVLKNQGCTNFIEIGPKNVLSGLIKRTLSNVSVSNFEKMSQLELIKNG
ncbi:MAG: ACP S-malonyltransferase [Thermodesulfobacteriota bacterium]